MLPTLLGEKYFPLELYSTENVGTIFPDTLKQPKLWTKSMGSYSYYGSYNYGQKKPDVLQIPNRSYANYFRSTSSYYMDTVEVKDPPKKFFLSQIIAMKRIHEVDKRCDRYCLLLSDGHSKHSSDQINTEEVYLSPDQNWLIEERHLKLYDVIRVTDYAVIPIPGNLKSVILFDLEVLQHYDKPLKLKPSIVFPEMHIYINVEKANLTNVKATEPTTTVRIASNYEQWLEGGGDIKGENVKMMSTVVKPQKRKLELPFFTSEREAAKRLQEDYTDQMLRINELFDPAPDIDVQLEDVAKYQKELDKYYESLSENKETNMNDHIHTPHCCEFNHDVKPPLITELISEIKSIQPTSYNLKIILIKKLPIIMTMSQIPILSMIATDTDGVTIEVQAWGKRATQLMDNMVEGYTYTIEAAYAVSNQREEYKRTDHPFVIRIGASATVLISSAPKGESTLVNRCIDSVTDYFLQNRNKRKSLNILKSREGLVFSTEGRLPLYLDIKGRTSLEVLTQLPSDIWEKVIDKLDFRSLHEIYYSKRFPFITSTHFSIAIKRDELQYYHMLIHHSQHLKESNDHYGILHAVYDNLSPFYCTTRDKDERELPKFFTNHQSEDYAKTSGIFPIAPTFDEFKHRFEKFTFGVLEGINWDNIFCAGGSILGPLLCETHVNIEHCHSDPVWKDSDIDLFIWGLDPTTIEDKIRHLYEVITRNLYLQKQPFLVCHSRRVITIVTEPPYRNIQIICYHHISPVDVLCNFDLDCCCVGYDGKKVWASPRSITKRYNLMDWHFAPTIAYSYRLYKYSKRGFCIAAPGLDTRYTQYSYEHNMYDEMHELAQRCFTAKRETWDSIVTPVSSYTVVLPKIELSKVIASFSTSISGSDNPYQFVGTINDIDFNNFTSQSRHLGRQAKFTAAHFPNEIDLITTNHHPLAGKPYFDMYCGLTKSI